MSATKNKKARRLIIAASIIIPIVIALLFKVKIEGYDFTFLPSIYASINGLTAVLLLISLIAIKKKKVALHRKLMQTCMGLTLLFLIGYITYHITTDSTVFGDVNADHVRDASEKIAVGNLLYVYTFILLTHILLSVLVIPFVLMTFLYALEENFERHKRLAHFAWPIWFYIATSGVIVYLMISPYY